MAGRNALSYDCEMAGDLNPSQRSAVETLRGPLLVLAGAGTGKTRVVTFRIAQLIRTGTPPERILAVTFTKKAAAEMRERASALLEQGKRRKRGSRRTVARPEISTFHSLCVRILRRHIARLEYPSTFTIVDRNEQESQARAALREVRAPADALKPSDLLGFISRWKMRSIHPSDAASAAETDRAHLAAVAYRRYQANLKTLGAVDFDDLLLLADELFRRFPSVRRDEAARFDQILIDEYQDTNECQYQIIKGLAMGHRNLCVVGDDDQSIYGWRGAEVTHILSFQKDWPEAKVVRLENNYRSTAAILKFANTLIAFNRHRHEKKLRPSGRTGVPPRILQFKDETEEAEGVVADLRARLAERTVQPREVAILFRTNEQPRAFETELRRAEIPYVLIGGMSFFDRREVRDILAYLRVLQNPGDEPSLRRILNQPPRGISAAAQKAIAERAATHGATLWETLEQVQPGPGLTPKTVAAVHAFCQLIRELSGPADQIPVAELVKQVLSRTRYRDELLRQCPEPQERESRLAALEEIINAAANYDEQPASRKRQAPTALAGFLDELILDERDDSDEKEAQLARNAVALMTLHSAKGLEFPHVYLVGLEEGILPHKRALELVDDSAIDEERRLCYVGVTRAQERLSLSFARTRRKWGKPRETHPSRFLFEMTGQADSPRSPAAKPQSGRNRPKRAAQK